MSRPVQQADLFAPAPDVDDTPTQASDRELLSDVYDAAAVLSMGAPDGIGSETTAHLRGELLSALHELEGLWTE